jgi:dolichyl-phosphate-mannose--protein O-mannosyl transferase
MGAPLGGGNAPLSGGSPLYGGSPLHSSSPIYGAGVYFVLMLGLFAGFLVFSPFVTLTGNSGTTYFSSDVYDGDGTVRLGMALALILLAAAFAITFHKSKKKIEAALVFIILAGIILRFGYMLYTPFYIRGHDVMKYGSVGHLEYINHIYTTGKLPATNKGLFYHPPLEHVLCTVISRLYALITGLRSADAVFEAAKLIPCFASCGLLIVSKRLFEAFGFSPRAKVAALALIAFHPTFILLSASINNDMLSIFFMMTAFLYTVRWQRAPTYKNVILLAVSIGLAMSTKLSGGAVAVVTAVVFLAALVRCWREGDVGSFVGQMAAFAAVVFPLGLWYPIRNLVLFGQPISYVLPLPESSSLYIGNVPLRERFLRFSVRSIFEKIYCAPFDDVRIWEYVVQCSLFGEFTFADRLRPLTLVLLAANLLLILVSLCAMLYLVFADRRNKRLAVLSLSGFWLVRMVSFVAFNLKYPYGCTMDFRYLAPTAIIGAAFIGLITDRLTGTRVKKAGHAALVIVIAVFCVCSAGFFIF